MNGTVGAWIKAGYPHVKERNELPAWILPEHRFARFVDELGDGSVIEIGRPLSLDSTIDMVAKAPAIETAPSEAWHMGLANWTPHAYVKGMVESCLETSSRILGLFNGGELSVDPILACRGMVALSFAPFFLEGIPLLVEIAPVLKGDAGQPANLLRTYGLTLALNDIPAAQQVDDCITRYNQWAEAARLVIKKANECSYVPKLIGVTPPMSAEVVTVLTDIVKEAPNYGA